MKRIPLLKRIRESRTGKITALLIVTELSLQSLNPAALFALTSGPSQPEVGGFQPVGMSEMVDPFTGDFSYSIPLLDIGGYPLNLSYQSGVSMDQEASWTGLGWNLHTGAITRQMRGLPDDFSGDEMTERVNMKPNRTIGINVAFDMELFGFEANAVKPPSSVPASGNLSVGLGLEYNNYSGVSLSSTLGLGLSGGSNLPMNGNLNLSSGKDGLQISPNVSFSGKFGKETSKVKGSASIGMGTGINSRKGLTDITLSGGINASKDKAVKRDGKEVGSSNRKVGIRNGSSISFGAYTFTPSIETAMETFSLSGRVKIGGATLNQDFGGSISAYGSVQKLVSNEFRAPAFGYMYAEGANNNDEALLDYNREKDGNFSKHHKHLPLTAFTNDMFQIAAQGLSGSFRAYRNDIGYVYNNRKVSPSTSGSLGVELGLGNIADIGVDLGLNTVRSESGPWRDDNQAAGAVAFRGKQKNDIRESFYLRMTGEKIPEHDMNFMNASLKDKQTLRYNLAHTKALPRVRVTNDFTNAENGFVSGIGTNARDKRQPRNNAVYFLTAAELHSAYPHKSANISAHAKPHHIAEIIVVTPEGMRYVFGRAAYNTLQVERSFATGGSRKSPSSGFPTSPEGLVYYNATAASAGNDKGIDNFFQETETPAFVHSWMLTEILSPDYSDLTGNGPSQDDLGAYVFFRYGNAGAPDVPVYGWRTPTTGAMTAAHMEGLRTNPTDDRGSVVYGTKELWYCHSIESKTHRVDIELQDRLDGCGVDASGNVQSAQKQKCIKSIAHTSLEAGPATAPVKKIFFEYDYTLCPGSPNSLDASKGKLTLKKLYFTYGNSYSGQYSPYEFTYAAKDNTGAPFSYTYGCSDRWGQLKDPSLNPASMANGDYPYAIQDKALQDMNAAAWSLTDIDLPSGGKMHVSYESDDYGYVQDRRACNMYQVQGFASSPSASPVSSVFSMNGASPQINEYLIIQVPDAGATLSPEDFRQRYLQEEQAPGNRYGPLKYLYFRFLMNVNKPSDPKYEYVSGYAEIDYSDRANYGMLNSGTAYIRIRNIQPVPAGVTASPFAYAAWSFSRMHTPEYAYNQPQFDDSSFEQIVKTMASASVSKNMFEMLLGVNRRMMLEGYGSGVDVSRSWVRLFDPDFSKLGGGLRVKRLEIEDNWDRMSPTEAGWKYGQEYSYVLENGRSSGVAAWEPSVGADENPFKLPVYSDNPQLRLVMDERYYIEEPFGESFFPPPGVGYARVEVKDIVYDAGITHPSTGKSVQEFYTARDFPIITRNTRLEAVPKKSNPIVSLLSFNSWNHMTVSQGYSIELNDMHGKLKAVRQYAEGAAQPFSYTEHYYRTNSFGRLDNMFPVLDTKGVQSLAEVGVEYDMVADFREQDTKSTSGSLAFNLNYGQAAIVPIISFSLFPGFKRDHTRFRSAVVTKVIQRYGLEEKILSYDKGTLIETRTMALDGETGNILVQELNNEYRDKYYKTTLPAHWAYNGMDQASQNILFRFGTDNASDLSRFDRNTGEIKSPLYTYLTPGDEVFMMRDNIPLQQPLNSNPYRYWVSRNSADGKLYLIDCSGRRALFGNTYPDALTFCVVRSGHRNMQQSELGSLSSVENPVRNTGGGDMLTMDAQVKAISTGANEYREQWQTDFAVPNVEIGVTEHVVHNNQADYLMGLFNQLYAHDFMGPEPPPLGPAGWNNNGNFSFGSGYEAYTGPLFGCADVTLGLSVFQSPASLSPVLNIPLTAFGYPGTTENSVLSFTFTGNDCATCTKLEMFCVDDISSFGNNDWWHIHHFNHIIATQHLVIPGSAVYSGPVACHLASAVMLNGTTHYFIIIDHCFGSDTHITHEYTITYSCLNTNQIVNPYIANILGNWRTNRSWLFQGDRNNKNPDDDENLRRDGWISKYKPFWVYNAGLKNWEKSSLVDNTQYNNWNWTSEATVFSPYGFNLESRDPLGIFSGAIYGFKNLLAVGAGSNARNKEIAFDGFEDYYASAFSNTCYRPHSWFADNMNRLTATDAHSGKYSMQLTGNYTRSFKLTPEPGAQQNPSVPYTLNSDDLLYGFSPSSGVAARRFILSFWAKGNYTNATYDYTNISADVQIGGLPLLLAGSLRKSDLVEGWQKYDYVFNIPAFSSGTLDITFQTSGVTTLFDDIRIHSFDGNLKSFVYDRENFLYTAGMDENNFATFYEYDKENKLARVKKETERGIVTMQESRSNTFKR